MKQYKKSLQLLSNRKSGMTSLIVVIVISAVTLLIANMSALTGIEEVKMSLHHQRSRLTLRAAEGCMEEGLTRLNEQHSYSGGSITINGISCTITVSGSGTARTLRIVAIDGTSYRQALEADIDWSSTFRVLEWREMSN